MRGCVSHAWLLAVRFTGGAEPSAFTSYTSKLVDHGSVLPAMRIVNRMREPSALKAHSSSPPNGFEGTSPSSDFVRSVGAPALPSGPMNALKRCDRVPSLQVSQ